MGDLEYDQLKYRIIDYEYLHNVDILDLLKDHIDNLYGLFEDSKHYNEEDFYNDYKLMKLLEDITKFNKDNKNSLTVCQFIFKEKNKRSLYKL